MDAEDYQRLRDSWWTDPVEPDAIADQREAEQFGSFFAAWQNQAVG